MNISSVAADVSGSELPIHDDACLRPALPLLPPSPDLTGTQRWQPAAACEAEKLLTPHPTNNSFWESKKKKRQELPKKGCEYKIKSGGWLIFIFVLLVILLLDLVL